MCLVLTIALAVLPTPAAHAANVLTGRWHMVPTGTGSAVAKLVRAINHQRAIRGMRPLLLNRRQSQCSLRHSRHMMTQGEASHDQFPSDICIRHQWSAENVGFFPAAPGVALLSLNRIMMHEGPCPHAGCPGNEYAQHDHYTNLMNPTYRHIGVGVLFHDNTTWLTEDFTG